MTSVLHCITTISRGGAETQLLILARQQVLSGKQVTVVFLKGSPDLRSEFISAGIQVEDKFANLSPLRQVFGLRAFLLSQNYDLVHNHLPRAELIFRLTFVRKVNIFSRHNAELFYPNKPKIVSRVLSIFATARSTKGIAISNAVRNFCIDSGEVKQRVEMGVVHYGYDAKFIDHEKVLTNRKYTFGTVARLVPQKDLPTLLVSFKHAKEQSSNIKLLIIGDGKDSKKLHELSNSLGLSDDVTWIAKSDKIPSAMLEIETFVLPSLYEGFGLVLLEAMSAKCAILAANNSAIPEVLGEDFPGLFKTGEISDLTDLMLASRSEDFRTSLLSLQQDRLKLFSPVTMESQIDSIYRSLLS